jgi:Methyltransferase domain
MKFETCKICNSSVTKKFEKTILNKYKNIGYFECENCAFIQINEPTWLNEAYQSAITSLDIGILYRNELLKSTTIQIINTFFQDAKLLLDYAGGYGIFTRIMRDAGFNYYWEDKFCENIFAKHFTINDIETKKFDFVTAFEVLEHMENPMEELSEIFSYSHNVLISTELIPEKSLIENWWYIAPETGQHISFYTKKSLELIAEKYDCNYYNISETVHLFTKKELDLTNLSPKPVKTTILQKIFKKKSKGRELNMERKSLLETDFYHIKEKLKKDIL